MKNKIRYIKTFLSIISKYDYSLYEMMHYALLGIRSSKKSDNGVVVTKLDEFILFQMIPSHGGKKILSDRYMLLQCINHHSKIMSGNLSHKFLFETKLTTNCQKSMNTILFNLNEGVNL